MPDKKDPFANLPVIDNAKQSSGSGASSLLDKLPTIGGDGNSDNSADSVPRETSVAPQSMQSAVSGADNSGFHNSLQFANDVYTKLLGKPANIPSDGVAEQSANSAKKVVSAEIDASKKFIAKDVAASVANLPDPAKDVANKLGVTNPDFLNKVLSDKGNEDALKTYVQTRVPILRQSYQEKQKNLDAEADKLKGQVDANGVSLGTFTKHDEEQYKQQSEALKKQYTDQENNLMNAAFNVASLKVVNNKVGSGTPIDKIDPYEIGADVSKMIGNEDAIKNTADKWRKYGKIDPTEKVNTDLMGYRAMQYAAKGAIASGNDELAAKLLDKVKDYPAKVIANNPEFKKQQISQAITDVLYKDTNPIYRAITGYTVSQDNITAAAKQLGLSDEDIKGITPDDISVRRDILTRTANSLVKNSVAPISEFIYKRGVAPWLDALSESKVGESLGMRKPDYEAKQRLFDSDWYDNSWAGRFVNGNSDSGLSSAPNGSNIIESGNSINTQKGSPNFLMTEQNSSKAGLNFEPGAIANTVADGVGQIASYALGGGEVSKVIQGANIIKDAEMANRIGLGVYNYFTAYDNNYRQATQAVGNAPEDEAKRTLLAHIYTGSDVLSEQIFPDYKYGEIFNTSAGHELINRIQKEGVDAVTKESLAQYVKKGVMEWAKDDIKEGLEEVASVAGNAVGDMIFAPNQYKNTDYATQAVQNGILGAVSAAIPTMGHGFAAGAAGHGPVAKQMMFEVGSNPEVYINDINDRVGSGQLSRVDGDAKISTIKTLSNIVAHGVPDVSVINNKPLTDPQQEDYAANLFSEAMLNEYKATVKDDVQIKHIDLQIEELKDQREYMLLMAGKDPNTPLKNAAEYQVIKEMKDNGAISDQTKRIAEMHGVDIPALLKTNENEKQDVNAGGKGWSLNAQGVNEGQATTQEGGKQNGQQEGLLNNTSGQQGAGDKVGKPSPVVFFDEDAHGKAIIPNTDNTTQDATKNSQGQQQQEGQAASSISQHQGTESGQQQNGQGEGSQRQATQPEANSGNSTEQGQQKIDVPNEEKKTVRQVNAEKKAEVADVLKSDPANFEEYVLQSLLRGTRFLSSDLTRYAGIKGKELINYGKRIAGINKKGIAIDQFVNDVAEKYNIQQGSEVDKINDVVQTILAHPGNNSVLDRLKYLQSADKESSVGNTEDTTPSKKENVDYSKWDEAVGKQWEANQVTTEQAKVFETDEQAREVVSVADDLIDNAELTPEEEQQVLDFISQHMDGDEVDWHFVDRAVSKSFDAFAELAERPKSFVSDLIKEFIPFTDNSEQPAALQSIEKSVQQQSQQQTNNSNATDNQGPATGRESQNVSESNDQAINPSVDEGGQQRSGDAAPVEDNSGQPSKPGEQLASPATESKMFTPLEQAINDFNKYNKFTQDKENKITNLNKREDRGSAKWKEDVLKETAALATYRQLRNEKEREVKKLNAKEAANELRKKKVSKKSKDGVSQMSVLPIDDRDIYNAAIEVAARAIEAGAAIRDAVQRAVEFINQRWFTSWDEARFRDMLGENTTVPPTAEQMRALAASHSPLSVENKQAADALVESIKNNDHTLESALEVVNTAPGVSPAVKSKIMQYVRSQFKEEVLKGPGQAWAEDFLSKANGDFDMAMDDLGLDYDTQKLNATTEAEEKNLRHKYAAAQAYLESKKAEAAVKDGTIKPVSTLKMNQPVDEDMFQIGDQRRFDKLLQDVQDRYRRLSQAQSSSKTRITERNDAVAGYRLAKPRAAARIDNIREYLGDTEHKTGSFFDRLKKANVDIQKFGEYLFAKHAPERNAYNAESRQKVFEAKVLSLRQQIADSKTVETTTKLTAQLSDILNQKDPEFVLMPDGGSGMTNQESQNILDKIEKNGDTAKYEEFAKEFRENVVDKIVDFKYDSGLINATEYNRLKSFYTDYVPLKVDLDSIEGANGNPAAPTVAQGKSGKDLFKSKGAADVKYQERNNPVLQSIADLEYSAIKGEENLANLRMASLIDDNKNPDIWDTVPARYDVVTDKEGNVTYSTEKYQPKNGIPYWEDGKKSYIVIKDKALMNTFHHMNPTVGLRMLQRTTGVIRNFATLTNPAFLVVNPIIDVQDAWGNLSETPQAQKNFAKNIKSYPAVLKSIVTGKGPWADVMKEWKDGGGKITFMNQVSLPEQAEVTLKNFESYNNTASPAKIRELKSAAEKRIESPELATRIMVYKSAIDAGMSKEKAVLLSRDATVDFEKGGVYSIYLNAFKAFLNAGTQGNYQVARLLLKNKTFRKAAFGMVVAGLAQGWLADMFSDCEHDPQNCIWQEDEWRKEKNFMIPAGLFGGKGFISIPVSRQLGWFNYVGQSAYGLGKHMSSDGVYGVSPAEFTINTIKSFIDSYNQAGGTGPLEQQVFGNFAPIVGLVENKNTFGEPYKPDNKSNLPEHLNFFPKTPEAFVEISEFLSKHTGGGGGNTGVVEISPNTIDYIMQSTFSGLYGFIKGTAKTASAISDPNKSVEANDIPVLNRFARSPNMSVTKQKKNNLVKKAEKETLTQADNHKLEGYLSDLVEGGQMTSENKNKTLRYVRTSQQKYRSNIKKYGTGEDDNTNDE